MKTKQEVIAHFEETVSVSASVWGGCDGTHHDYETGGLFEFFVWVSQMLAVPMEAVTKIWDDIVYVDVEEGEFFNYASFQDTDTFFTKLFEKHHERDSGKTTRLS